MYMKPQNNLFVFLMPVLLSVSASAQINAYARVTAISGTTLTLSNVTQTYGSFTAGEQIIVMQMQDNVAQTNTSNNASFGTPMTLAMAGAYEIATISSVAGLPASLTISAPLVTVYNLGASSNLQIISFPSYGSPNYTTTAAIKAMNWTGIVGGVVAFQVPGTLTLAYSVTADGAGFRGGGLSGNYEVDCEQTVYASNSSNYGGKGEGYQVNNTGFKYGRAGLANGGGGGSDDNGGGGGGGNYTAGGEGGPGWTCAADPVGGFGGFGAGTFISKWRIFMGGGGGGAQQNNGVGSGGGNGGGIVIIKATTLVTSCAGSLDISAGGNAAANSVNDGAGGAGAAGSIVLSVTNFNAAASCPLTVQANGGNGGNVNYNGEHGGGGGGGQGVVIYPSSQPATNITTSANNGNGGSNATPAVDYAGSGSGTNGSGILTNNGGLVLAIVVSDFSGREDRSDVVLDWNTASGQTGTSFVIQRSADGRQFMPIGKTEGNHSQSYSFTDANPNPGKNFYRVEVIGATGETDYTSIVEEDFAASVSGPPISVFPNPVVNAFTVRFSTEAGLPYTVDIFDRSGKKMQSGQWLSGSGEIQVGLVRRLTSGIYMIRVSGPRNLTSEIEIQ